MKFTVQDSYIIFKILHTLALAGVFLTLLGVATLVGVFAGVFLALLGVAALLGVLAGVFLALFGVAAMVGVFLALFKGVSNNSFIAAVMGVVTIFPFPPDFGVLNNRFMPVISGVLVAGVAFPRVFLELEPKGETNVSRGTLGVLMESKSKSVWLRVVGVPVVSNVTLAFETGVFLALLGVALATGVFLAGVLAGVFFAGVLATGVA